MAAELALLQQPEKQSWHIATSAGGVVLIHSHSNGQSGGLRPLPGYSLAKASCFLGAIFPTFGVALGR